MRLDKFGNALILNDYVLVRTAFGEHKGYINLFQGNKVRVNCLAGEFRTAPEQITLIAHI